MSSGNKRLHTKLWATRPPSPFSHTRTLAVVGSGLPSNWNVCCHPYTGQEVDTTFVPVLAIGSRMTIFCDGRGGVLVGASPEPTRVYSDVHCLWGACCCAASRAPGTKRLTVIVLRVTMFLLRSDSVSKSIDSAAVSSVSWTIASGSIRSSGLIRASG